MSAPTVLSTFSGIGGLDLGFARAGWSHALLCEADPYRRGVLAERFPGVPILEDVREVAARGGGRPLAGVVGGVGAGADGGRGGAWAEDGDDRVDLVVGGPPCQDFSIAGKRVGLDGLRGTMFFEFLRVVGALRPRFFLAENVPGILNSRGGEDFGRILDAMADLGYGVAWRILDSRYFGVPQRRRRVFIVGTLPGGRAGAERAGQVLAVGEGCERHPPAGREAGADVARGAENGAGVCGVLGGTPPRSGWRLGADEATGGQPVTAHTLTAQRGGPDGQAGHLVSVPDVSATLKGGSRTVDVEATHIVEVPASVRRLTPRECERLQGLPDDWTLIEWKGRPAADSLRYAALGDAVTANVSEWIGRRILAAM